MSMKLFKKILLVWMIVWLPVAGAMAATMPLSGSTLTSAASGTTATVDQETSTLPCHGKVIPGKIASGQSCSHCVLCHLAGALVMPELPVIATLSPTHIFSAAPAVNPPSFIPELTAPPPRVSLA